MNTTDGDEVAHTVAVRRVIEQFLFHWLGKDVINGTIIAVLPPADEVENWTKEEHIRRTTSFFVIFGVIGCAGIVLLEGLRLCMNCYIKGQKRQRGTDAHEGVDADAEGGSQNPLKKPANGLSRSESDALLAEQVSFNIEDALCDDEYCVDEECGEEDEDSDAEDQAEATRKRVAGYIPQDLFFVAWQHTYIFGCLALATYAFANDYLSEDYGLDFELYIPWLIGTVLFHIVCLAFAFRRALDRRVLLPSMLGVIPKTAFLPTESHLGALRDAVSAGIFARHSFFVNRQVWGPLLCSAITTICIFLPNAWIYCDLYPFRDFQEGFWPVITATDDARAEPDTNRAKAERKRRAAGREEEEAESYLDMAYRHALRFLDASTRESYLDMAKRHALRFLDASTREHKQAVAWLGDIPQAVAGAVFLTQYAEAKNSLFILAVTILAAVKSSLVVIFRPHILCALASFGLPWSHLTENDVNRAIDCSNPCTWICRSKACRGMLKDVQTAPRVRIAAINVLDRVYDENSKADGCAKPTAEERDRELEYIRHAILWEVAMHSDRQTQLVAMRVMRRIKQDDHWAKVAWQLQRLRSDDPDEKRQAVLQLAENYPHYAGAYISDLCRLLAARTPARTWTEREGAPPSPTRPASVVNVFGDQDSGGGCCSCFQRSGPKHNINVADAVDSTMLQEKKAKAYQQTRDVREAASRALGLLGRSSQDQSGKVTERERRDISEVMQRKAPEVVRLLGSADREVRSAALSAVYHFRGEAAVTAADFAMGLLELSGKQPGKRKAGEIALVELLPVLPPEPKGRLIARLAALLHGAVVPPRNAAYRVLCRLGGRVAGDVRAELERRGQALTSAEPIPKELAELSEVLRFQENAVREMGGNAAAAEGLNLVLHRRDDEVKLAQELLEEVRGGAEVFEALERRGLARKVPAGAGAGAGAGALLVYFTDLEPDDVMFMAQMWRYTREKDRGCRAPLVIFSADLDGKDSGGIFEKKILLTALIMGQVDIKVLTPGEDFVPKAFPRDRHPRADAMERLRRQNIKDISQQIKAFGGTEVKFYVCAPGRGNLGDIVRELSPTGSSTPGAGGKDIASAPCSVNLYSGQFNIKGMSDSDLNALHTLVGSQTAEQPAGGKGGVLVDAAKFPFFGGEQNHELTKSFTTFALPSFAPLLSCRHPLVAAVWGLMNDEFNQKLIAPEKLFESSLAGHARAREIEKLYEDGRIKEYAQLIASDAHLMGKVAQKKKVTLRAFACDCCDAPLCDQLLFLNEWVANNQPPAAGDCLNAEESGQTWVRAQEGAWNFNKRWQYTSVDTKPNIPGLRAVQPVMRQPHDVEALYLMSEAMQKYTLGHLEDVTQPMDLADVRRSRVFSASGS